eukprot:TRINITY_DN11213_c0_g2_i3.p1 TRINITY_DN11213_c0_g2~~TRINITY_DN11213_c0_g2_i3.p1  ORF type:complete len:423 (+),score=60.60 TRINITY_DN11213_c0_g2_i3:146-1414(+)
MQNEFLYLLLRKIGVASPIFHKHYRNLKHEDIGFKGAMLARIRQAALNYRRSHAKWLDQDSLQKIKEETNEELNNLEVEEHWEITKADLIEQTYNNLRNLHKILKNRDHVVSLRMERLSSAQNIIDPNMFPIFSLKDEFETQTYFPIWQTDTEIKELIAKTMKYSLEVKLSSLEHHEAGNGVFLKTDEEFIPEGTMLGFIPGVIHPNFDPSPASLESKEERKYIHRYDLTMIDFSAKLPFPYRHGLNLEDYEDKFESYSKIYKTNETVLYVPGESYNPYAVGHRINHPPPQTLPNVIVLDLIIPRAFFTGDYLKYFPYIISDARKKSDKEKGFFNTDCYHGLAVVALRNLKNGEELFMDYNELFLYMGVDKLPDWLVEPPPLDDLLLKRRYEHKLTPLTLFLHPYLKSVSYTHLTLPTIYSV